MLKWIVATVATGAALIVAGIALFSPRVALIAAGACLLIAGLFVDVDDRPRPKKRRRRKPSR